MLALIAALEAVTALIVIFLGQRLSQQLHQLAAVVGVDTPRH
jgi:hypothetical protein